MCKSSQVSIINFYDFFSFLIFAKKDVFIVFINVVIILVIYIPLVKVVLGVDVEVKAELWNVSKSIKSIVPFNLAATTLKFIFVYLVNM